MNHVENLFARFHKLHPNEDSPVIGIGLDLVCRIVSRHGGEICTKGEPGQGACFWFALF